MRHKVVSQNGDWSTVYSDGHPEQTEIAIRYLTDAYPDEPLFCIRGRDKLAVPAATAYLGLTAGLILDGPVMDAVLADIARFQTWQAANPSLLKYPDRPRPGTIRKR